MKLKLNHYLVSYVDDDLVGEYYEYLETIYPNSYTFNNKFKSMRSFYNYLIKVKQYDLYNPFIFTSKPTQSNTNVIEKHELIKLFSVIMKESGVQTLSTGEKKYHYFSWLKDAIMYALYLGRRPEEITTLKFSDIICDDDDGSPLVIKGEDQKVNKFRQVAENDYKNKKYFFAPVFPAFKEFLMEQGFEQHRGTDRFLIAPGITERVELHNRISASFTHFWRLTGIEKEVTFYNLRKTYLTAVDIFTDGNSRSISLHSDNSVLKTHYIHNEKVSKEFAKRDFSIY